MKKLIRENIIYITLTVVILSVLGSNLFKAANNFVNKIQDLDSLKKDLVVKQERLAKIKEAKARQLAAKEEDTAKSGKIIYEVQGEQFSPDASFGIMFENILSNITASGVRVRSIDYNYSPQNDIILSSNVPGYNACELSFVTVSTYSQLQSFFKNLAKQNYLSGLYEVYIEPYDKDKSVLISRFKVRIYTKTI